MDRGDRMAFALFALVLFLSPTLPFCSAAYSERQQQSPPPVGAKKGWSPPSSRHQSPPVDLGWSSSAVFPLHGNVYPDGLYYVELSIGEPPKPYFLDVDTGSDLTWVQCDAPCVRCSKGPHPLYRPTKDKLVPCEHPICVSLQSTTNYQQQHYYSGCESPNDQCDYQVEYADSGSSHGVLISDAFSIRLVNGSLLRPHLAFGCGYDQQMYEPGATSPTDGVLGLGLGKSGILTQLRERGLTRNVMGHCLSRRGGGFLFFGDDLVPRSSAVTWTPMSRGVSRHYYSPGPANVLFGKQTLVAKDLEMLFDSGSSYTYFSSRPYQALLYAMMKDLSGKSLRVAPEDRTLPLCWKGSKPFKSISDVKKYFKPLTLGFAHGKSALLEIPPEDYLIVTKYGNACLGILNGTEVGLNDLNIIGDISMQDLMVVYDNEREQIGWARVNCDRIPKRW